MLNEDTITIDGVTMTIDEYLNLQEKKKRKNEGEKQFFIDVKKYDYVKHAPRKLSQNKSYNRRVIWSRKYTKADIEREMKKMNKNLSLNSQMVHFLKKLSSERRDSWFNKDLIIDVFPDHKKSSITAILSVLFKFLNEKGLMIRRKGTNGFEYNIPKIFPEDIETEYKKWLTIFNRNRRNKKKTDDDLDKMKKETEKFIENGAKEIVDNHLTACLESTIPTIPPKIEINVNVKVSGKINVAFFSE